MHIASPFDDDDLNGASPSSAGRSTVQDADEREKVGQFLNGGGIVMGTSSRSADVMDPGRGHVVPMFYMTDGEWIWPDAIAYYLTEHNIPIETDFLDHIRSNNYLAATPDVKQIEAALAVITNESREESLREWRSAPEVCIVRTKQGNEWSAAFAIDGRNYASRQEFSETVTTAFDLLNSMAVIAEFETGPVGPGEPIFKLPTWEEYRESVQDNSF